MNRQEILDLLLKDHSHDFLIEHPELYSIDEDIYQWMFEKRDYWNQKIPRIMDGNRRLLEKIKREEPEEAPYYEEFYTEEYIRREAYRFFHEKRRFEKLYCYRMLAKFWRCLLTARPEFASRCPWHVFRGDNIWMTLRDEDFCKALAIPKAEIALKMPLKLMSVPDWEELLKIVPELQPEYDRLLATGYKFEALCC